MSPGLGQWVGVQGHLHTDAMQGAEIGTREQWDSLQQHPELPGEFLPQL